MKWSRYPCHTHIPRNRLTARAASESRRSCKVKHSQKILPTQSFPSCKVGIISRSTKINDLQHNIQHYHRYSREIKTQEEICLSLSDLTSLSMIISRPIHAAANGRIPFFLKNFLWRTSSPLYICATSSSSIHLSMDI